MTSARQHTASRVEIANATTAILSLDQSSTLASVTACCASPKTLTLCRTEAVLSLMQIRNRRTAPERFVAALTTEHWHQNGLGSTTKEHNAIRSSKRQWRDCVVLSRGGLNFDTTTIRRAFGRCAGGAIL
jgi:hypothetical protein